MRKITILLITAFMAFGFNGWGQIISQYIETNSGSIPKGIEIWNSTAGTLDFSVNNLVIEKGTNGATPTTDYTLSSGTLASGDVIVIGTSDMEATTIANGSVFYLKAFNFNGDDALVVKYGTTITDVFGEPGTGDPGSGWSGNGVQTWNQNIGLKAGITTGDVVGWTDPSIRFEIVSTDPFVDGPIGFGIAPVLGGNLLPEIANVVITPSSVLSSSTVSVSADVTDSDGTVSLVELHWGTATGVLTNMITMSNGGSGDTYTTLTDIPTQADGATVYYKVYAEDDLGDDSSSPEFDYTVIDPATTTLPYTETFDANLGDCYTYSVSGDTKEWYWNSGGYAYMSGYNSGVTEEDWLVLPGINLDDYSNEFMTFETQYQYGTDDENNYLKLYYSTDYSGVGDPTTAKATWTELPYNQPSASQVWESSGYVDLTGISGTMVYITFKYNYEFTMYRNWGVDNISISEYEQIDWANLQYPGSGSITVGTSFTVYAQAYEPGVTDSPGQGAGITTWIGYSTTDTDPATWTDWVPASYLGDVGNNDEYSLDLGLEILTAGTYYYASRFQLGTAPLQYGGFSGGFWDGVSNVSGVLTVNPPSAQIDWANVQWPPDGTINFGDDFNVYAQVFEPGVTDLPGQGADITAWIGYSTTDSNPATWTEWIPASFNTDAGPNDEYMSNIGAEVLATGTVYYASRFKLGLADYVYGGFNSGFWDGTINVSGELTVNLPGLFISEVADPGDEYQGRFVEIYNAGGSTIDLAALNIYLVRQAGGSGLADIELTGSLASGETYVIANNTSNFNTWYGFDPDQSSGSVTGNGDDGYYLYLGGGNATGTLFDSYGELGVDGSGEDWEYLDTKAVRLRSVALPNPVWDASEWDVPSSADVDDMTPQAHSETRTWVGTLTTDWRSKGTNWDGTYGYIPDASDNVDIPAVSKASFPVISGTATCNNITMAAGSSLDISPTGALTVIGTFADNGGTLTIKSDVSGTGSLIENSGVNANVERFFSENAWHYVATPTDNVNTGVYTGLFMMYWDEPAWLWKWVLSADSTLAVDMQGYALWSQTSATTVTYTGALNAGAKTINLTNTSGTGTPDYSGFNLVGNPYPSSVNWNNDDGSGWTRTNMDMSVWVWNPAGTGNYGTYVKGAPTGTLGVDNILAPHQGFFVHSNGSGSLSVDNAAREHSTKDIMKNGKSGNGQYLLFKVEGNGYSDEVMINQNNGASYNLDINDGLKMYGMGEAPQLYTISSDGEELSINSIPGLVSSNLTIPMNFKAGVVDEYVITLNEIEGFENTPLYLEDLQLGKISQITNDFTYSFKASAGDDENRFLIHFSDVETPPISGEASMLADVSIYSYDKTIYLFAKENITGTINVYDLTGKVVLQKEINESTSGMVKDNSLKGFYIVTLVTNNGVETQKVYIK